MGAQARDVVALLAGHHVAGPQQPLVVHAQSGVVHDQEAGVVPLLQRDVDTGGGRRVAQRVVQQHGERVHDGLHGAALDHHRPHLGVLDPLVPLDPAHGRPHDVGQRGGGPAPGQLVPGEYGVPRRREQHLLREVVDLHERGVRLVRDVPPYALADGPAQPRGAGHDVVGEAAHGGAGHADGLAPYLGELPLGVLPHLVGGVGRGPLGGRPLPRPYVPHRRGHRAGYGTQPLGERCPVELRRYEQPARGAGVVLPALRRRRDHGGREVPHALFGRDELQGEPVGVLAQLLGPAPGLLALAPEVPRGPDCGHRQHGGGGHYQFSHLVLTDRKPSIGLSAGRSGPVSSAASPCRGVGSDAEDGEGARHGSPGNTRGPVRSRGRAGDADSRRHGTAHPEAPRTPVSTTGVRRSGRDHTACAHVVLTRRVGLVTTTWNRRGFDAKNALMTPELLWLKR
ncbi:hypothetical protein OJ963_09850 [Streptomyces sp. RS2]|nr:hypothetical protein [Streptomyces sp. RS2]MCW1094281.1 hypothetical protein [Streptomyces sp. RS2]